MPSGNLDRYITIESYTEAQSSSGYPVRTYSTYSQVWAERLPSSGDESVIDNQITAKQGVDWMIRYDSGVNEKMRISYGSEYYNIESVEEIGRRYYLKLKTYRVDA